MASQIELFEKLKSLNNEQFQEVLFRLEIEVAYLPENVSQVEKAIEVIKIVEQEGKLQLLESTLENPAIKKISLQSAANPIKAQVDQIVSDYTKLFVGRDEEEQRLDDFLTENSSGMLLVRAGAGMGKTALLANWKQKQQQQGNCFIAYHFFRQGEEISDVIKAYRHLLRQLYAYYELTTPQVPSDENNPQERIFQLLQEPIKRPDGKPLIILLDALDEATPERSLSQFLPQPLPEGLYVIASVRVNEEENLDNLPPWIQVTKEVHLKHLPSPAVADWLRRAGNGELATLAEDETFVAQVCDRTEGIPLFLKYLIDELVQVAKQGEESAIRNTLAATPKGFANYIRQQYQALDRLEDWRSRRDLQKIFYFLTIAKGELSSDDLVELMEESPVGLPWQVSRWFKIRELEDCLLFSFAHPSLAEQFAALPTIKANTKKAQKELIKYCAHWQEYHSAYALRHYAEHLQDVKRWEELYALAQDEDFASTQRQYLPDEPDLPLKTVQTALLGAAEEDKAEIMAKFVLIHAHRLGQTNAQESPLDALRSGSLKRAWVLAEHFEIERCILWYLLLAWELKDEGKLDDARETLERLQEKELPRFSIHWSTQWQREYAEYLLAHIFELSEETCIALHQKLFEDADQALLFYFLIECGDLKAALEITRKAFPKWCWLLWMKDIAKTQMEVGQSKETRATFAEAIETAHQIENSKNRTNILISIANSQADVGLFSDARETLQHIDIRDTSQDYWTSLVEAQAKIGNKEQAIISLNQAKQLALNIEDKNYSNLILSRIASKQAEIGELTNALETVEEIANFAPNYLIEGLLAWMVNKEEYDERDFTAVLEAANRIYDKIEIHFYKAKVLKEIVAVQVKKAQRWKEDFTAALTTTSQIKDKRCKAEALLVIVKAQTQLRWFEQALETADMIEIQEDKDKALVAIIQAQATTGQFENAFTTGSQIQEQSKQEDALLAIANAYAQAKNFSHAIKIANGLFNPFKKVELLKSIATIQSQTGLVKEARDTLAIGLNTSLDSEVSYHQAFALVNVAEALLVAGLNEKGFAYAKDAYEISKKINELSKKVKILADLGEIYAQAGQRNEVKDIFTEAIEIVCRFEKKNPPNHVDISIVGLFTKIGIAQAKAGEFDAALETLEKIKLIEDKALVLKTLAQAHPEAEKRERLKAALTTIYEDALSSFNLEFDHPVKVLSSLAVARMELGEREAALAIFSEACEIVKQEKAKKFRTNPDSLLSTVAVAQAEAGEITISLETVEQIEDGWKQVKALSKIASYQAKKGDKEGLSATLDVTLTAKEKITDEEKRIGALWMIAQIQAMAGQVEQAFRTAEQILTDHNQLLSHIATNLIQLKDKDNFKNKKLLIPCAYSLDTAYKMCGCLGYLYPENAESIAEIVKKFILSST